MSEIVAYYVSSKKTEPYILVGDGNQWIIHDPDSDGKFFGIAEIVTSTDGNINDFATIRNIWKHIRTGEIDLFKMDGDVFVPYNGMNIAEIEAFENDGESPEMWEKHHRLTSKESEF
jgi:hypothetical protein